MKFTFKDDPPPSETVRVIERDGFVKLEGLPIETGRARLLEHCRSYLGLNSYDFSLNELKKTLRLLKDTDSSYMETVVCVLGSLSCPDSRKLGQIKTLVLGVGGLSGHLTISCNDIIPLDDDVSEVPSDAEGIERWISTYSRLYNYARAALIPSITSLATTLRTALLSSDISLLGAALKALVFVDLSRAIAEWQGLFPLYISKLSLKQHLDALLILSDIFLIEPTGRLMYDSYGPIKQQLATEQCTIAYTDVIDTSIRTRTNPLNFLSFALFIVDQRLLEEHYRKDLVSRLLDEPDIPLEKAALAKLSSLTSPELGQMSKILINDYEETQTMPLGQLQPVLIGKEAWSPLIAPSTAELEWQVLPPFVSLKPMLEAFAASYKETYRSRSLTWLLGLSTVMLTYKSANIYVNYTQAAVLLSFNDCKAPSFTQLAEALPSLKQEQIREAVQSMNELLEVTGEHIRLKALSQSVLRLLPEKKGSVAAPASKAVRLEHDYV